ncbi:MAG: cytochrome C, partial [Nitrospiraceae bacterium]
MRNGMMVAAVLAVAAGTLMGVSLGRAERPVPLNVDLASGAISVPENYADRPTLGTWAHARTGESFEKLGPGVHEYHVVYT